MQMYQPRKVELHELLTLNDWRIKVYTITHRASFASPHILANAIAQLPQWLANANVLKFPTYNIAFIIVHEGRDGVWTLVNWWLGGEMLQSFTYFTDYETPHEFTPLPRKGFMACVWELAVISFERAMWIEHILKKAKQPDFTAYCQQYLQKEV
jgi:hypothetical protein